MLQRTLPAGFVAPCLPTKTNKLPSGSEWLHEIKHDGFRVVARKTSSEARGRGRLGQTEMAMIEAGRELLILKRASASRPSGEWNDDDYDVLANGALVGRMFNANAAPIGLPWMWTLAFEHHEDRTPTHGYAATREAAMAAFAKSWRRE